MKNTVNTRELIRLIPIALVNFSILFCCGSPVVDSTPYDEIKKTINSIRAKETLYIDENIIGDCIYYYLEISENEKITKKMICDNFNNLFDKYATKVIFKTLDDKDMGNMIFYDNTFLTLSSIKEAEYICILV